MQYQWWSVIPISHPQRRYLFIYRNLQPHSGQILRQSFGASAPVFQYPPFSLLGTTVALLVGTSGSHRPLDILFGVYLFTSLADRFWTSFYSSLTSPRLFSTHTYVFH